VGTRDKDLISRVEGYVEEAFAGKDGNLIIAHDFRHVDRVRNWALRIAKGESFSAPQIVEVAALLHDIGLPYIDKESERGKHGEVGAEIAGKFLRDNSTLTKARIEQITLAIRYHGVKPSVRADIIKIVGEAGKLMEIISDADMLDAVGAVGLMRAFTSKYFMPEYDPDNVKGETWELPSGGFTERLSKRVGVGKYIIDQVNFQISYYGNLRTKTARQIAEPFVQFMKDFVLQLEHEIGYYNVG